MGEVVPHNPFYQTEGLWATQPQCTHCKNTHMNTPLYTISKYITMDTDTHTPGLTDLAAMCTNPRS